MFVPADATVAGANAIPAITIESTATAAAPRKGLSMQSLSLLSRLSNPAGARPPQLQGRPFIKVHWHGKGLLMS
jgi:hypothetical protein